MTDVRRIAGASGSLLAAIAVGCGAFGAHALRDTIDPAALAVWRTAVDYQFLHAIALILVAVSRDSSSRRSVTLACVGFLAGSVLFSGSLYALALGAPRLVGALTPVGGIALIGGWIALAFSFLRMDVR